MAEDAGGKDVKKTAFVPKKTKQKGKLSMNPILESSWKSTDYLAPTEESISFVGKSKGMMSTTSGVFVPQTVGVGQMKLDAPPRYSGKRQPGVQV